MAGVLAGRCWINGGRWERKTGNNNSSRAPSCDRALIVHNVSSSVWTEMEETFKKDKNRNIFLKIDIQRASKSHCSFNGQHVRGHFLKSARDTLVPTLLSPEANI